MPSEEIGSAYAKLGLDDKELDRGLSSAKGKFSSAISSMESGAAKTGKAIGAALATGAVAAGVALAGVATVGVKTFMDVESAAADAASKMDLSAIAQASGKSIEEAFVGVKEHVMALSDELGQLNTNAFDPTTIAQACADLASGGFDVATASAKDLSPMLALATATNYDLGQSCAMVTNAMSIYGKGVEDISNISDVYARACADSKMGMEELNYSMKMAGPAAAAYGVDLETTVAMLENFAEKGIKGEMAGTALRDVINSLGAPTDTVSDGLLAMGISCEQVDPRFNDVNESLKLMYDAAQKSGEGAQAFTRVFGINGALIYGLAEGSAKTDEFRNKLLDCAGAAETMARLMLDSLGGSLEAAMGAASSLAYLIGGKLAPSIKGAFEWFSAEGAPAIRAFIEALSSGEWGKVGEMLSKGVRFAWAKLNDLGGQLLGWLKAVNWSGLGQYVIGGIYAAWDGLKSLGGQLLGWLKGVNWGGLGEYVTKGIYAAWGKLKSLGGDLLASLAAVDWGSIGTSILSSISSSIDSVIDYAGGIYDYFAEIDWGGVWDSLVSAWDAAIAKLSNVGSTILGYFDSIDWGTVGFKIGTAIRDAIQALSDIGSTVWNYLTSADWSGAGSSISEKVKGGLAKLKEFWTEFKSGLSAVDFATAGKEIGEKITKGLGQITDYAKSIYEKLKKGWDDWIAADGPKKLGESFAHSLIKGVVDLGKWIYDKIADYWKSNGSSIGSNFSALFHSAIDFGKTALKAAYDFVTGFANTVLTAGKGTIGAAILDVIGDAMDSAWDGAGTSLHTAAAEWRKDAESIWEASDFDTTIAATVDWLGGSSLPEDGETRSVTVVTTVTGEDITEKVKKIPGSVGPSGDMLGYWMGGEYKLKTPVSSSTPGIASDVSAKDWAYQMGLAGADFASTRKMLSESSSEGYLRTDVLDSLMSEFAKGQEEYDAAHKTAAEEAAEVTTAAAEDAAETTTEAAEEAAATTTETAKDSAATEQAAAKSLYQTLVGGSRAAANAIEIGSKIAAGSVKIGLNSAGQEIAIIGQVAQQRFTEAGGILYDKVQVAGSGFSTVTGGAAATLSTRISAAVQNLSSKMDLSGGNFQSKVDISGSNFKIGAANAVTNLASKLGLGASDILTKSYNAGNALLNGGSSAGSALSTGASAIVSAASKLNAWGGVGNTPYGPYQYASGTVTSGPQMAVIGEDGPANPEYVIPTKTKRWDLLKAAMRDYGIPGFAEGTSTGGATVGGEGDAPPMSATFGIVGLAGMAKQVKKIITDLKDFFRISWGIVKAEGSTYWKQINTVITTEVTSIRDTGWQAALDIRNAWLEMSKTITDDSKASWVAYWPAIEPTIISLKESLIGAFTDAGTGMKDAIDSMVLNSEASLQAFEASWSEIWAQLVTDMTDARAKISEGVAQIAAELQKISVNVNISMSSGGGSVSGGGFPGDWDFGGADDWLAPTGDWSGTWSDYGSVCGQSFNQAVQDSIMPLDDRYTGGSGTVPANGGGYWQLPSIFMAKGALVEKPTEAIIGEAGPEMVLPAKLTRMFVSLADIGLGSSGGSAKDKIVIEDRTEHHWYMDGKEVTNVIMDRVMKQLQLRGAVPAK
jgi:TP901 family phage tail tape measure protein